MLDRGHLPVELLYNVFDYLSINDIVQALLNMNSYLNNAIRSYDRYHADFQSCPKRTFHRICSHIQPKQIISLTLSNNNDTPDQFQLFFSVFNIEQFIRLRSITLINIENNLLRNFIDSLNFEQLESLKIIPGSCSQRELPDDGLRNLLPHKLKRLNVYNASCINMQLTYHLQCLTVHDCEMNEFQQILSSMPMLQFLKVINHTNGRWITVDSVPIHLKRLVLNLNICVSMTDIEEFLVKLINLRHLELQIKGNLQDLCNGERWSTIARNLITFDFYFQSENNLTTSPQFLINSFRSPFWSDEKRWFVAYYDHPSHIFTVPRFADISAYYSTISSFHAFHVPKYSTVPSDQSLFQDHISSLMILNDLSKSILSHRFMHIKTLTIANLKLLDGLRFIVDLSQIRCLKLMNNSSTGELERVIPNILPQIHELHLSSLPKGYCWYMKGIDQIRTLHIQTVNSSTRLCSQFPCIERLHIGHAESYRQIRPILSRLRSHLSFVSLNWSWDSQSQRSYRLTQNLLEQDREKFNFTYRCDEQKRFSTVYLWISNNTEQSLHTAAKFSWNHWIINSLARLSLHSRLSSL